MAPEHRNDALIQPFADDYKRRILQGLGFWFCNESFSSQWMPWFDCWPALLLLLSTSSSTPPHEDPLWCKTCFGWRIITKNNLYFFSCIVSFLNKAERRITINRKALCEQLHTLNAFSCQQGSITTANSADSHGRTTKITLNICLRSEHYFYWIHFCVSIKWANCYLPKAWHFKKRRCLKTETNFRFNKWNVAICEG